MGIAQRLRASLYTPGIIQGPYQLQLHPTDFCNLQCVFCPTKTFVQESELDKRRELSTEQWLVLIDQAADLGVEEFHLCGGGEPLFFRRKALTVMRRIKELGKHGEIITNGTLFTPESARELVRRGWDKLTFSVDGPNAKTHDRIRGKESFQRIVDAIERFTHLKKEHGRKRPQLCIHFVVCNLNYQTIAEMVPLCERLGIDTFLVQALNIWSEKIEQYGLSEQQEKELRPLLKEAQAEAEKAGISTNIPDFLAHDLFDKANVMDKAMTEIVPEHALHKVPCYMPWYNLSVFADGRVLPCFILREGGISFKEHSLAEAWNSNYFRKLREQMLANTLGSNCAKCNPWSLPKTEEIRMAMKCTEQQAEVR